MTRNAIRVRSVLLNATILILALSALALTYRQIRPRQVAEEPPFALGTVLPDLQLRHVVAGDGGGESGRASLAETIGSTCAAFMFVDPYCPACIESGPQWARKDSVSVGGVRIPIVWVSIKGADTATARYVSDAGLVGKIRKAEDEEHLKWRIYTIPHAYVVSAGRELLASGTYHTEDLTNGVDVDVSRCAAPE